ncbi:hypothetical protein [Myxococcus sp. MxC21-1]|uniref:hypothetical protein n=1 Tax=Myxococcus sp. MxC21-1 TaxID=3041439 RepID=UPI003977395E
MLYSKLALILVHQRKDYRRAVELLERAVALEPNHPVFQQNLLKVTGLAAAALALARKRSAASSRASRAAGADRRRAGAEAHVQPPSSNCSASSREKAR